MSEQLSLFICDVMDFGFRDDMLTMENPLFALTSGGKADTSKKVYEHNGERHEIIPSGEGHATIFDKDILLYCVSYLMEAINKGDDVSRKVRIILHDFMATTQRSIGGGGYKQVEAALTRLKGTQIKSTLLEKVVAEYKGRPVINDFRRIKAVGLIEEWEIVVNESTGQMANIDITLPEWLFVNVKKGGVLKINPDYFRLRRGLDRRLYEIGRKHIGNKKSWKIGVDLLHKKSGSTSNIRRFRQMLATSIQQNLIPDLVLEYGDERKKSIQFLAVPDNDLKVFDISPKARRKMMKRSTKRENDKILKGTDGFTCPICQKVCKSRGGLGSHLRTHKD